MDLVKRLEEYRDRERGLQWEGTFAQYFELASKKPEISRLSHERIYHMIMDAGVDTTRTGDQHYKFFSHEIFGIEKPLQQIVDYFHSAAQCLEVRKRILLLMEPIGGGKSTIVSLMKRGLEAYSRTDEGSVYAIKDCLMHEEPLHLIPHDLCADVEKKFGLYVEGDLCPHCRYIVDNEYAGRIEAVPVKRIAFSEKYRYDWSLHHKGQIDQERHKEKAREAIKKSLGDIVSEKDINLFGGKKQYMSRSP